VKKNEKKNEGGMNTSLSKQRNFKMAIHKHKSERKCFKDANK
jgi:hypothetical protein